MGERICSIEGCAGSAWRRGWCQKHYVRYRKAGGPNLPRPSTAERFWSKVDKAGPVPEHEPSLGACWLWGAALGKKGYGSFGAGARRTMAAHRWAYEDAHGQLPLSGLELDHLCRVRNCVNPAHLEPVTHTVNMRRSPISLATLHASKTHCAKGHPLSGANLVIVRGGFRSCRECRREGGREHYRRQQEALGLTVEARPTRRLRSLIEEADDNT